MEKEGSAGSMEDDEEEVLGLLDKVLEDEDWFESEMYLDCPFTPVELRTFKVREKRHGEVSASTSLFLCSLADRGFALSRWLKIVRWKVLNLSRRGVSVCSVP